MNPGMMYGQMGGMYGPPPQYMPQQSLGMAQVSVTNQQLLTRGVFSIFPPNVWSAVSHTINNDTVLHSRTVETLGYYSTVCRAVL